MSRSWPLLFLPYIWASIANFSCSFGGQVGPLEVLHRYGDALHEGRAEDAYSLLSRDAKQSLPLSSFSSTLRTKRDDAKELASGLEKYLNEPKGMVAVVTANGLEVSLVYEKGAWRLTQPLIDSYVQDTPRHAVLGFILALEKKRYDVLLRFIPKSRLPRSEINAETLKNAWEKKRERRYVSLPSELKQALMLREIEERGERATLSWSGGVVQLVREDSTWKIEDF